MKKWFALLAVVMMLCLTMACTVSAEEAAPTEPTLSNGKNTSAKKAMPLAEAGVTDALNKASAERWYAVDVTVAGDAVATARNLRVPFGTPATELFRLCGLAADPTLLLFGDMMTGQAVSDPDTPILPGVTCLLALCQPERPADGVCVGCGRCVQVCHAGLMPEAILQLCEKGATDQLAPLHPEDCDGCGACSAVCPAGRELARTVFHITREEGGETP